MWEYITGAIVTPLETFRDVAQKKYWKQGLLLIVVVGLIKGAASVIAARSTPSPFSGLSATEFPFLETLRSMMQSPSFMLSNALLSSILFWFVAGAICFGIARLFKGEGTLGGLLAGFGFASSPNLIGVPLAAVLSLLGSPGMLLSSMISFGTGLWVFVLEILSIRESMGISTGAAVAALLIAFFAFFCALIIFGLILSVGTLFSASGITF
ncbi:MAG TPA: YIP1 family protein [Syntrophomonadaceae bacterium]|nr:YIP1 family protein [Syntrophomonadaceae bacterium]